MRYRLGRWLQVAGLIIIPIGMAGNIMKPQEVSETHVLISAGVGALMVGLGWLVQGPTR